MVDLQIPKIAGQRRLSPPSWEKKCTHCTPCSVSEICQAFYPCRGSRTLRMAPFVLSLYAKDDMTAIHSFRSLSCQWSPFGSRLMTKEWSYLHRAISYIKGCRAHSNIRLELDYHPTSCNPGPGLNGLVSFTLVQLRLYFVITRY
jgi:hypothetical protein